MGRVLSRTHAVTIATPFQPEVTDSRCVLAQYSFEQPGTLTTLAEQADVMIVQGYTLAQFPTIATLRIPIVVDLYCPFTVEHLEMITSYPPSSDRGTVEVEDNDRPAGISGTDADVAHVLMVQNMQLLLGDFFICASERQRDFWIGALQTAGRLNLRTYGSDRTLRSLIDVVPFGVADAPVDVRRQDLPGGSGVEATNVLKGVHPGMRSSDHVLIWGGSILDWQDPQTLVRAVAGLAARRDDIKLFFMGTRHPNPQVAPMRAVPATIALAREFGVLDTHVFFNDWVPYSERWRYLKEADLGCSTHREHLETRLSFRTRMLDYLWAGLPIVCTSGDVFASLVAERRLGLVVPPGDVDALERAIERLIDDPEERARCRMRLLDTAKEFRWSEVVAPLARFCDAPHLAADHQGVSPAGPWTSPSYRFVNWMKRGILATGISRKRIEQLKRFTPIRLALRRHNRALLDASAAPEARTDVDKTAKNRLS
jgi:hypothetical protein